MFFIGHVHFNDPNRRGPGEGALHFAPIVRTLFEQRYDGWIGVEPFVYEPDGPACAARAAGYVQGLAEALANDGLSLMAQPILDQVAFGVGGSHVLRADRLVHGASPVRLPSR